MTNFTVAIGTVADVIGDVIILENNGWSTMEPGFEVSFWDATQRTKRNSNPITIKSVLLKNASELMFTLDVPVKAIAGDVVVGVKVAAHEESIYEGMRDYYEPTYEKGLNNLHESINRFENSIKEAK